MALRGIMATPEMRKAASAYESIFGSLQPDRAAIVRQMLYMFQFAWLAYTCGYADRTETAGDYAYAYCVNFAEVGRLLGSQSDAHTLQEIQGVSDWLRKNGWTGIPDMVGSRVLNKTAAQEHDDMLFYRREKDRLRATRAASGAGVRQ